jgi:hypothetical protein
VARGRPPHPRARRDLGPPLAESSPTQVAHFVASHPGAAPNRRPYRAAPRTALFHPRATVLARREPHETVAMDLAETAPRRRARADTRRCERSTPHNGVQELVGTVVLQGVHDRESLRRLLHPDDQHM